MLEYLPGAHHRVTFDQLPDAGVERESGFEPSTFYLLIDTM